jgi:hypothetical protein
MCPGLLCDTSTGTCAECVTDADCAHGHCRSGVCAPTVACTGDRECTTIDEVCDRTTMVCVECGSDADCVAPRICAADHSCAMATCASTAASCDAGPAERDAGVDAGHDAGVDAAGADAGADAGPAMWEVLTSPAGPLYGGYTDHTPAGASSFYSLAGASIPPFARYDVSARTWTALPGPALADMRMFFSSPAWVGNALYTLAMTNVYRYDIAAGTWTTLASVASMNQAQSTHDDAGHVFAVTSDDRIATYDIASNMVSYQPFGRSAPVTVPRIAWDAPSARLYVMPSIVTPDLYSFVPATGAITTLAPMPGTTSAPELCGDRTGSLYGTTNTPGDTHMWRYDIPTNTWLSMPDLPFPHGQNGSCTVSDDGYLYLGADPPALARIRVR